MKLSNDFHSDATMPPKGGSSPERDARLTQAMNEYLEALEAGKAADRKSLLDRFPDLGAELITCLDGIDFIHEVAPQLGEVSLNSSHENSAAMRQPNAALGDYRIIRELGRGGMGVVYEAEQLSMRRRVALKVLPFASVMDQRQIARFKNEAQAAGLLQHTNIVPVYGVGCERAVHYFAMQYIEGMTLAEIISELTGKRPYQAPRTNECVTNSAESSTRIEHADGTPMAPHWSPAPSTLPMAHLSTQRSSKPQEYFRTVARLGIQAAEALDHAHQNGILHRDVKPGNLMLDNSGNLWVTDFGLARMEGNPQMTMTGDVLGTLRYMSPEQALAKRVVVDHRSDIYSLGVTLYELLSLRPAFEGLDRGTLLRKIADEDPQPLRRVDKSIPSELETIVSKAIAKNPEDRYATAQDLADDLRRLLMHEPVRARNPSLARKLGKWIQRHRSLVYSAAAFTLAASLILASSVGWIIRDRGLRRLEAESRLVEALDIAEPLLQAGNPHQAELVSAVRKAEAQLASASGNPQLDERVFRLRSDLAMLNTLEQARLARSAVSENHFDEQSSVSAYEAAFREYGIDIPKLSQAVAANLVSQRTIALQLAVALDDWASMLLSSNLKTEANHLLNIAELVDPDVWRNRLRGALEGGDANRLSQLAREAQVDSLPVTTQVMLGKALVNHSKLDEAAFLLKRAQPHFPGDFWINHDLGAALMLSNQTRFDEAVGYLRTAIALRPQSPGARLNLAYALEKAGRLEETVPELQEAIRLKPDYDGAFSSLAHHLLTLDRPQEALTYFRKALELRPESSLLHCDLGECLRITDMFDEAIAAFQEAIRLSPDMSLGYNDLGLALFDKGLHEEGLSAIQQGLAIEEKRVADSPQHPGSRHMLAGMQNNVAMVLMGHGEQQQAESLLRRAIESESQLLASAPNDRGFCEYLSNMHHTLADLLQTQGKHIEAEAEVRSSLKHKQKLAADVPSNVSYQVDLALTIAMLSSVLTDQGAAEEGDAKYAEAITVLQRLIAEFPTIPRHRFNLAIVRHARALKLQAQDRPDEVKSECQQAITLLKQLTNEFPANAAYEQRLADCRELLLAELNASIFIDGRGAGVTRTGNVIFGPDGNLYLACCDSDSILCFDGTNGALIDVVISNHDLGLDNPWFFKFGPDNKLYVAGALSNNVIRWDPATSKIDTFIGTGSKLRAPKGMVFDASGDLYICNAQQNEVLRYAGPGGGSNGEIAGAYLGVFVSSGSGELVNPNHLEFHGNYLYVTNTRVDSINRYDATTGAFVDVFVEPNLGGLDIPNYLRFGPDGYLYVCSQGTGQVLRFDSTTGSFVDVVAAADGSLGGTPTGLDFDVNGNLMVANGLGAEILRYRLGSGSENLGSDPPLGQTE